VTWRLHNQLFIWPTEWIVTGTANQIKSEKLTIYYSEGEQMNSATQEFTPDVVPVATIPMNLGFGTGTEVNQVAWFSIKNKYQLTTHIF